jgi:hypothetical protein
LYNSGQFKLSRDSTNDANNVDEIPSTYFIGTARLQTAQLIRELPIVVTNKHEFTSRFA